MADDRASTYELEPREPTVEDLRDLCRELNRRQARYIVVKCRIKDYESTPPHETPGP